MSVYVITNVGGYVYIFIQMYLFSQISLICECFSATSGLKELPRHLYGSFYKWTLETKTSIMLITVLCLIISLHWVWLWDFFLVVKTNKSRSINTAE